MRATVNFPLEQYQKIMKVNLEGVFALVQASLVQCLCIYTIHLAIASSKFAL